MLTRRRFLTSAPLAAASAAVLPSPAHAATAPRRFKPGDKPRRIIHMVSDGMSVGTLTCADHFSHLLRQRGLTWLRLNNLPEVQTGLMNMRSLNSLVTDSSAASSSWGCGTRIINGMVNQMGDGTPLTTLYQLFGQAGWKRGLVTTTEITHATPAGFAADAEDRDHATRIAAQYLDRRIDVLLGGGRKFLDPKYRKDERDLEAEFVQAGYHAMHTRQELLAAPDRKPWLGTFARGHLPFTVDQRQSAKLQAEVPTLAEMTRAALKRLGRHDRFILQVEGGRVDHGCHNCDAPAAIYDQVAFDEAIDVCLEFQVLQPDTLIVITTDHGNGNLGLNGSGSGYGQSSWKFANLLEIKASFPEILKKIKRKPVPDLDVEKDHKLDQAEKARRAALTKEEKADEDAERKDIISTPQEIVEVLEATTGYKLPLKKAEQFHPFLAGKGECLYDLMKSDLIQLGQLLGNHLSIGWSGNAHTADYVQITAVGPGSERFRGYIQNTDVFHHYLALAGIDFRNRTEPLLFGKGPEAGDVENFEQYGRA